jgi:methyl-accepting chemotaxis protein
MREPNTFFQDISLRRRLVIAVGMFMILTVAIGLYGLIAIVETNGRLHESVRTGQAMIQAVDTARLAQVHFKKQVQEWKDILLRGNEPALFEKHMRAFEEEEKRVSDYLQTLAKLTAEANLKVPEIDESIRVHEQLGRRYREALETYKRSDLRSAVVVDRMVRGIDREPTDRIDAILDVIRGQAERRLIETETMAKTKLEAYQGMAFFLIFLVLAAVGFGLFSVRSIINDLPAEEGEKNLEGDNP